MTTVTAAAAAAAVTATYIRHSIARSFHRQSFFWILVTWLINSSWKQLLKIIYGSP
jgi:hypothetical protein